MADLLRIPRQILNPRNQSRPAANKIRRPPEKVRLTNPAIRHHLPPPKKPLSRPNQNKTAEQTQRVKLQSPIRSGHAMGLGSGIEFQILQIQRTTPRNRRSKPVMLVPKRRGMKTVVAREMREISHLHLAKGWGRIGARAEPRSRIPSKRKSQRMVA